MILRLNKIGYFIAVILLIIEFPIQNIIEYQSCYWGFHTELIQYIIKVSIKVPALLALLAIFIINLKINQSVKEERLMVTLLIFFSLYSASIIIYNIFKNELTYNDIRNLKLLAYNLYFFLIGYFLNFRVESKIITNLIQIGHILMLLQVLIFIDLSNLSINFKDVVSNHYIHLTIGNSLAIWSIIVLFFVKKKFRFILYIINLIFIFFASSRTAFYCYFLLIPLLMYYEYEIKMKYILVVFSFALFGLLSLSRFSSHRMLAILSGNDESLINRTIIFKASIKDIISNWFMGDYGNFVKHKPPANTYVHNILSYWRQFGIIAFTVIIAAIIISIQKLVHYKKQPKSYNFKLGVYFSVFLICSVIFAKSYHYSELFLMFGICINIDN